MKRIGKTKADEAYLRALGQHIATLIGQKGYKSPYDFWIRKAGDQISRASLNYILAGRKDMKITTLRSIAKLLKVQPRELLEFEPRGPRHSVYRASL